MLFEGNQFSSNSNEFLLSKKNNQNSQLSKNKESPFACSITHTPPSITGGHYYSTESLVLHPVVAVFPFFYQVVPLLYKAYELFMTNNKNIQYECVVDIKKTLRDAISVMSKCDWKLCVIIDDDDKVFGVFTEGDYRKVVVKQNMDLPLSEIVNRDFVYLNHDYCTETAVKIFASSFFDEVPVLKDGKLIKVLHSSSFLKQKQKKYNSPVVIMAGGRGKRLDPFTRILPKPLIPVGTKPIIQVIMDNFQKDGFSQFLISVNDKAVIIKSYFSSTDKKYDIEYITEEKELGTAGALGLVPNAMKKDFFLCNCDILLKLRHEKVMQYHRSNAYDLTIVAAQQNHKIDYGVCNLDENGALIRIEEKPTIENLVVTGLYVLSPNVLKYIPKNERLDMPDLIEKIMAQNLRVGIFPVPEDSWSDIGQWSEFNKFLGTTS